MILIRINEHVVIFVMYIYYTDVHHVFCFIVQSKFKLMISMFSPIRSAVKVQ